MTCQSERRSIASQPSYSSTHRNVACLLGESRIKRALSMIQICSLLLRPPDQLVSIDLLHSIAQAKISCQIYHSRLKPRKSLNRLVHLHSIDHQTIFLSLLLCLFLPLLYLYISFLLLGRAAAPPS